MIEIGNKSLNNPAPLATAFNPSLPLAVNGFFEKGLAKNPKERFQTIEEFYDAFAELGSFFV